MTKVTDDKAPMIRTEGDRAKTEQPQRRRYAFGVPQSKLQPTDLDPAYHYHWINDTPGRVEQALAGGYEHVSKSEVTLMPGVVSKDSSLGDKVSATVGTQENGQPLTAYLMKINREWYEESQAMIQQRVDGVDRAIRSGKTSGQEDGNFYVPKGNPIKIG